MPEKRSLVADFDDTIVSRASEAIRAALHNTLIDSDRHLASEEERRIIDQNWGSRSSVMFSELFKDEASELLADFKSFSPEKWHSIKNTYLTYMRSMYANHVRLIPGSIDVLQRLKLKKGYSIGITTATDAEVVEKNVFEKLNIPSDLIYPVISAESIPEELAKPHPYTVLRILEAHNTRPEDSAMVGDSINDVLAAKAAGIGQIIVVRTGLLEEKMTSGEISYDFITKELGATVIPDISHLESVL